LVESTAASSIGKIPGSCGDLQQIGHKKSGLFSIVESNKIVNVYCDFTKQSNDSGAFHYKKNLEHSIISYECYFLSRINKAALQKWIGYADVKSLPTYFYVQKNAPFSTFGVPIPFEIERLNIGGAMNIKTGKFTAPRKGVYFFAFSGVGGLHNGHNWLDVELMVNGVHTGRAHCDSRAGNEWETLTLQSTIELKAGDSVWLQIVALQASYLQNSSEGRFTQFSGWLLQEDLSP
jgi:hypothetical protein